MSAAKRSDAAFREPNYRHNLHASDGRFARKREWVDPQEEARRWINAQAGPRPIPTLHEVATPPPGQKFVVLPRRWPWLEWLIRHWMWSR